MTTWNAPCVNDELCEARPGHYGACDPNERAKAALANARRVSGDNAAIAVKALGQLGEAQQVLTDLVDASNEPLTGNKAFGNALIAARTLIDKQKGAKLYE